MILSSGGTVSKIALIVAGSSKRGHGLASETPRFDPHDRVVISAAPFLGIYRLARTSARALAAKHRKEENLRRTAQASKECAEILNESFGGGGFHGGGDGHGEVMRRGWMQVTTSTSPLRGGGRLFFLTSSLIGWQLAPCLLREMLGYRLRNCKTACSLAISWAASTGYSGQTASTGRTRPGRARSTAGLRIPQCLWPSISRCRAGAASRRDSPD